MPITVKCLIKLFLFSPGVINKTEFYYNSEKIIIQQNNYSLEIKFTKNLSLNLINDLQNNEGDIFFRKYIADVLPIINHEIIKQRYKEGHYLIKTFSAFDITEIKIQIIDSREEFNVRTIGSFNHFPPSSCLAKSNNELYIRDLIDAVNYYFTDNYDECIRKLITSAESAFKFYKLRGRLQYFSFRKNKFRDIVKKNIYKKCLANEVISENLFFIYKIRNKIVHSSFKINYKNGWFCKKAIMTSFYMFQFLSRDKANWDYIFSLQMQFTAIDIHCRGFNMENKIFTNSNEDKEKMDDFIFDGLRITNNERSLILKG